MKDRADAKKSVPDVTDDDENSESVGGGYHLPASFVPGPNDVVCARGKSYWDHEGNKKYRLLIGAATEKYSSSSNKAEKTLVVTEIVQAIHDRKGRFVKKEGKGGRWVVVDELFAREKVGQSLRDCLHKKYKSATKAKKQRRAAVNEKFQDDIESVILSNRGVSRRMEELSREVERNGSVASDLSIVALFSKANTEILETIKKDSNMLNKFQEATVTANNEIP